MRRLLLGVVLVLGLATTASAQVPNGGYSGQPGYSYGAGVPQGGSGAFGPGNGPTAMPNIYNPQTQPLSPYLNLFRGSNPATNYYYGVRPGTVGGGGRGGMGGPGIAMGGNRPPFFAQLSAGPDPLAPVDQDPGAGYALAPAGHPVVFNNTLGYFPGSFGSGMRPGASGIGNSRPAGPRR